MIREPELPSPLIISCPEIYSTKLSDIFHLPCPRQGPSWESRRLSAPCPDALDQTNKPISTSNRLNPKLPRKLRNRNTEHAPGGDRRGVSTLSSNSESRSLSPHDLLRCHARQTPPTGKQHNMCTFAYPQRACRSAGRHIPCLIPVRRLDEARRHEARQMGLRAAHDIFRTSSHSRSERMSHRETNIQPASQTSGARRICGRRPLACILHVPISSLAALWHMYTHRSYRYRPVVVTSHALIADLSALMPRYIRYQHRDGGRDDRKSWWWRRYVPPDMDPLDAGQHQHSP